MTASNTTSKATGSDMNATVSGKSETEKSPAVSEWPKWVVELALERGLRPATVWKRTYGTDNDFDFCYAVARKLMQHDKEITLDRRMVDMDLLRHGVNPDTAEVSLALVQDARADSSDEVPRLEYVQRPTKQTWNSFARTGWNAVVSRIRLLRMGERQHA